MKKNTLLKTLSLLVFLLSAEIFSARNQVYFLTTLTAIAWESARTL